jgi:hypothetical protein
MTPTPSSLAQRQAKPQVCIATSLSNSYTVASTELYAMELSRKSGLALTDVRHIY